MKAHKMRLHSTIALCLAMVPAMGLAQTKTTSEGFVTGDNSASSPSKPWTSFKLSKTKHVKLNFKNAGVDSVLQFFMDQTGVTILRDPSFKDPLTLASATPVTLDRAFDILKAVIDLRGFSITKNDDMLVIKPKEGGGRDGGGGTGSPFGNGFDMSQLGVPSPKWSLIPTRSSGLMLAKLLV